MSVISHSAIDLAPRNDAAAAEQGRPRVLPLVGQALSYVLLLTVAMAALAMIVIPLATGSQTYSVLTSSMAPKYAPGTFLVVKPTPFEALRVGDVITYQIESGMPGVISHRIISIGASQSGEREVRTQGDNNSLPDPNPVLGVQVKGKLFYAIPVVGFIANSVGQERESIIPILAAAFIGFGALSMVRGALEKKRSGRNSRHSQ
ncbi:signal peptidase I [Arthrobacter psychrochitiniphilus]|uniref:Signal peptidase I n=1 Tax=Arthrobacter psychrochitiniphilus TaxID=291045 RepID=A0A2V3DXL2_9MICC|nr:signal peptidase I [Arthrobacter psychrochitiniphilus]NYG16626.1 signal peptidase [Arthrobacter psychrochitiniphilus]PXA69260.1 signal peptidase I [Arthrobacter psychrochitiniphilus]